MAAEGMQCPWRWNGGTISPNMEVIWEMSGQETSRAKWFAGRRPEATLLAILLFTALVHLTSFQEGHNWGGDFSSYIHQAKSLVEGTVTQLRAIAYFRFENSSPEAMVGPTFYPWVPFPGEERR